MLFACKTTNKSTIVEEKKTTDNKWVPLFNGQTTEGWHTYGKETIGSAWKAKDGMLCFEPVRGEDGHMVGGGDIVTDAEFEDFHLQLEWKISKGGNSGIMFYVQEDPGRYEFPWQTGPEMQILDNQRHSDGKIYTHRTGDLYDLLAASGDAAKPVGEWNKVEIISSNGKLDFYLNGIKILSTTLWDESWWKLIAGSKFSEYPGFGKFKKGKIALQDHGDPVCFRNIRIKMLKQN